MKRHTHKNIKIVGLGLSVLAMVALLGSFAVPTWAKTTDTNSADVEFTFNPTLTIKLSNSGQTDLGEVMPGAVKESDPIKVTIETNSAKGYYLSATAGTETTSDLKADGIDDTTIKHLLTSDSKDGVSNLDSNTWGVLISGGVEAVSTGKYIGLPQTPSGDTNTQAAAGTKLLDADSASGDKEVDVKIGVKVGTLKVGTYKGQLNFYAVTK